MTLFGKHNELDNDRNKPDKHLAQEHFSGICPAGHYCTPGTTKAKQHPCPEGTFSPDTRLESEEQCTNCTAGFYCE